MKFEYPSQLPVSAARSDIAEAVKSSQVVIVSGQTGSGKTTAAAEDSVGIGPWIAWQADCAHAAA